MLKTIWATVAILFLSAPSAAQVASAELSGSVLDPSGAGVPGATVIATSIETNAAHKAITEKDGSYFLTQLAPGAYTLSVEATGFRKLIETGLNLQINQQARLDLTVKVGQVSDTLEVTGQPPLLQAESSSLGTVVNQQLVNELPLNGRNFIQLATLSPGVNGVGYSASGTIMSGTRPDDRRPGTEIFSNGNREGSNNFLYDGIDDNERLTLSIVLRPAVEAVREFKIQTNLYSADIGRNSGAVVDVITKSGTNEFHGSLFEFLRNSAMDARTFFSPKGTAFPSFRLNQYGGSFGGPLMIPKLYNGKNKTFFFADYEGYRRASQQFVLGNIPTLKMRAGDFSETAPIYDPLTTVPLGSGFTRTQFPNNQIPASRWDPIAVKIMNAYPIPTAPGRFNNYSANLTQTQNWDQGDIRVDQQISPKDQFFARYSIQNTETVVPSTYPATTIPGIKGPVNLSDEAAFAGTSFQPAQHAVASYVRVIAPSLVNEFRAGYSRYRLDYTADQFAPGAGLANQLGIPNANVTPNEQNLTIFSPSGYLGVGQTRSLPLFRRENAFEYLDNITWTKGSHTLKAGVDFRRRQLTIYQTNMGNGRFNFSSALTDSRQPAGVGGDAAASFLLGYPTLIGHDYTLNWPGIRGSEIGVYFADDWRLTKKLTLNLGIRWDYYTPFSEVENRWSNFNPVSGKIDIAGNNGVGANADVQPYYKNFGPRFGFAYQVLTHTVIRGGFGLFYNPTGSEAGALRLFRNSPFGNTVSISPGDITVPPNSRVSNGFPAPPTLDFSVVNNPTGVQYAVDPKFRPSYAEQFNLTVEHEIAPLQLVLKAATIGNLGRHLYNTYNVNQAIPGATAVNTRRPLYTMDPNVSDVNYFTTNGLSEYYAFQFTADKRFNRGMSVLLGYTWSHAIDNVPLEFGGGASGPQPQDPRFLNNERADSIIDMRQRLTLSYLWELPFGKGRTYLNHGGPENWVLGGWQLNGLLTSQSGLPFSPVLQTSTTNTGTGSRPNVIAPVTYPGTLQQWFSIASYGIPAAYTYGNAGRDTLVGPGRTNLDLSLFKSFTIREQKRIEFRAEAFNVFNHPQFGLPNPNIGNGQAGTITSIVGNPRQLQMGLRLKF
jgi:hypothetical protein